MTAPTRFVELTEAQAWRRVIEAEADRLERGSAGYLCNHVTALRRGGEISLETSIAMHARIALFNPGGRYAFWDRTYGDDPYERLLAACFCLAMCEAGEAV